MVVAKYKRAGTVVILRPGSIETDQETVVGVIPTEAVGRDEQALVERDWQMTERGAEHEWPSRTAAERTAILVDVNRAIDILAGRRGLTRAQFPLAHETALGSDPGYAEVGCLVAPASAFAGALTATVALLILQPHWLFRPGDGVVTSIIGLAIGWAVTLAIAAILSLLFVGVGVMSVVERIPRLRRSAADIYLVLMVVLPAPIAAVALWLTASANR